jgi:disulfide bond formation protein DsbB
VTRRSLILLAAGGSVALLAGAFLFQAMGYAPCAMCLWQRWPHGAAIALGALGLFAPLALVALAGAAAALTTSGLGLYHAGVEQGWWEGPSSCTAAGGGLGGLSGSDLLSVEGAGRLVLCDEVVWSFLGLSMAGWNALISLGLALVWLLAAQRPVQRAV